MAPPQWKTALAEASAARLTFFRSLGTVDKEPWETPVDPALLAGAAWPVAAAWRRILTAQTTILCTDGLANPFDDQPLPNVGFGLELFAETPLIEPERSQLNGLFHIVQQVSDIAAGHGFFRQWIESQRHAALSIAGAGELQAFAGWDGSCGVLIGLPCGEGSSASDGFDSPAGIVRFVYAQLLHPSELQFALEKDNGAMELRQHLDAAGFGTHCLLGREAVI